MNKIGARIIADSSSTEYKSRITSLILTYPRFIHSEFMTHRVFSRNAASSRAIPFKKMADTVYNNPFIPIAWQKNHKGMQGNSYHENEDMINKLTDEWVYSAKKSVRRAEILNNLDVTKQLTNRILEPYMWYTCLVTATDWSNFFDLRCPVYEFKFGKFKSKKDVLTNRPDTYKYLDDYTDLDWLKINKSGAEIHIQALAEAIWDTLNESEPVILNKDEWHIPFNNKLGTELENFVCPPPFDIKPTLIHQTKLKVATARCARLSYNTFDGKIDFSKDIELHDMLLKSKHASPFEHCAKLATDGKRYGNFKGFKSYRYILEEDKIL